MSVAEALVTGASSGIGAATARLLAERGARVALLARDRDRLESVRDSLPGEGHLTLPCDLRRADEIARAIATLGDTFDGLDLLVNGAGIGYRARVEELEDDPLEDLVTTNFTALVRVCRDARPLLLRGSNPVVVNIGSVVGRRGIPGQVVYAATKAAVTSLGEGLRIEWAGDGIAVCTLQPGVTDTAFFGNQPNPSGLANPDMERADSAEAVARAVVDLAEHPRPERSLRPKWRAFGVLSAAFPRLADRLIAGRLDEDWQRPKW